MGTAWTAELIALLVRSDGRAPAAQPSLLAMAAALAGFLVTAIGAWHGGVLVYRLGADMERPAQD